MLLMPADGAVFVTPGVFGTDLRDHPMGKIFPRITVAFLGSSRRLPFLQDFGGCLEYGFSDG